MALSLIDAHDFVCFQETHGQEGSTSALALPAGHVAFWNNGSTHQAGIGVVVKHAFLKQFNTINPDQDWIILIPGRLATLRLHGPHGNLDITCAYFDATSHDARRSAIHVLSQSLRGRSVALSIVMGDFNFVMDRKDRWSSLGGDWAANGDLQEAELMHNKVLRPFGLVELEQDAFTCESTNGCRARLDRIYQNQHTSMQMDRLCTAHVRDWCPELSAHRPVCAARSTAQTKDWATHPKQSWAFKHSSFSDRVHVEDTWHIEVEQISY